MVKIKELRRGNILSKDGEYVKVLGFFNEMSRDNTNNTIDFIQLDNLLDYVPEQHEAIPLTEEWLKNLGLIKQESKGSILDRTFYWCHGLKFYPVGDIDKMNRLTIHKESFIGFQIIDYVHDLQNVVFALTREEIDIKKGS